MLRRMLYEPLVHFLVLGCVLFALYGVVAPGADTERKIVVDDATVAMLAQRYASVWLRQPSSAELQGLVDTYVREEILYREGVAMGLDRDDPVIQRRVLQKLDVLSEESSAVNAATDVELEDYLQAHAERYAIPSTYSFEQVLFDPVRHGPALEEEFNAALAALNAGADPAKLGDSSLLPLQYDSVPLDRIARDYGEAFAVGIEGLSPGRWQGPVRSGFGVHAVRVNSKTAAQSATLADVRAAVERDWENDRRVQAREAYYQGVLKNYTVQIDADLLAASAGRQASAAGSRQAEQ